jgi:NTE family protein
VYFLDGRRVGDFSVRHARVHLDVGVQNKFGEVRLGGFAGRLEADEDFGVVTAIEDVRETQVGFTGSITFDQIDSPGFAREGVLARLTTFGTLEEMGSDSEYNRTELLLLGAKTWGKHSLQLAVYGGANLYGRTPAYDPFLLGGFLRGSGYRMDELLGEEVALGRAVYTYQIGALPPPLGRGVFLGGSLEATRATLGVDVDGNAELRPSASLFVGADTFLGPVYLGWGRAFGAQGGNQIYLLLGSP